MTRRRGTYFESVGAGGSKEAGSKSGPSARARSLESANALELAIGDGVTALIKAPHVILAVE